MTTSVNVKATCTFSHLIDGVTYGDGSCKHVICATFPKGSVEAETLQSAVEGFAAAYVADKGLDTDASAVKSPIKDGDADRPDDPDYAGKLYVYVSTQYDFKIVDAEGKAVAQEIDKGASVLVTMSLYGYHHGDTVGVGCGLKKVQLT